MENEFMKRGYLLPQGCKDLIDVLRLRPEPNLRNLPAILPPPSPVHKLIPLPPVIGELVITHRMTVRELAELLKSKPFEIIGDLMELGIFATIKDVLSFDIVAQVARKHGYIVKG